MIRWTSSDVVSPEQDHCARSWQSLSNLKLWAQSSVHHSAPLCHSIPHTSSSALLCTPVPSWMPWHTPWHSSSVPPLHSFFLISWLHTIPVPYPSLQSFAHHRRILICWLHDILHGIPVLCPPTPRALYFLLSPFHAPSTSHHASSPHPRSIPVPGPPPNPTPG